MGTQSKIEWTDHTFNPWIGCTKVSPGCANCYAESLMDTRYHRVKWGKGNPRARTSVDNWKLPVRWNRDAAYDEINHADEINLGKDLGEYARPRVFCASLADWLDDEVPIEWLSDLLKLIHDTPNLDWLLLTKRPGSWRDRMCAAMQHVDSMWLSGKSERSDLAKWIGGWIECCEPHRGMALLPSNVWVGTTVENQEMADKRIPLLLDIPAKIRFLSVEPMLEPVDLEYSCFNGSDSFGTMPGIHWVICGGESGANKRPFSIEWARDLRDQCGGGRVPFFMKQVDKVRPIPEDLMVRQFPRE